MFYVPVTPATQISNTATVNAAILIASDLRKEDTAVGSRPHK